MTPPVVDRRADDERWRNAIDIANIPTLLVVLVQLTGNLGWMDDRYRPSRTRGLGDNDMGGLSPAIQHEVRAAAIEAFRNWSGGAPVAMPEPDPDLLVRMLSFSLGDAIPSQYSMMVAEELRHGVDESDHRLLRTDVTPPPAGFRALIIGAGMSGIYASIELARAGVEHTVIERHHTVGGTWLENRYPGCGVDVPSHLYSYPFASNEWTKYFALRDEIYAYFERVADEFGVRQRTRFGTEVTSANYEDDAQEWVLNVVQNGTQETLRANVLISCVGAFNKPQFPKVEGRERFDGPQPHTALWPTEGVDLDGKRVAIIGNGASAMQIVPAIADRVGSMVIVQRSPHWATPFEKFGVVVPEDIQFLLREMPLYRSWYRLRLGWAFNDKSHPSLQKDPNWPTPDRSLNVINDAHRQLMTRYIKAELGDRQDLLPQVLPTYPPFGKRMLLDNGWYRTIRRDNVELVTDRVVAVEEHSITTEGGRTIDADVLIWATGFDVIRFLAPMEIRGRGGVSIEGEWDGDDARAYLGTAVPGFPNLFVLYGPNTQFGHGGSLISVVERQVHYLMGLLETMFSTDAGSIEVRRDVHDRYNERVDAAHEQMVWTHQGMRTYYRNSKGRVVVNNPFRIIDMWQWTASVDPTDYVLVTRRSVV